jgi:hypothetical protein
MSVRPPVANVTNNVEIYKTQAEIHKFELPPEIVQRSNRSELVLWMSQKIDQIASDKSKFPDSITGRIFTVTLSFHLPC